MTRVEDTLHSENRELLNVTISEEEKKILRALEVGVLSSKDLQERSRMPPATFYKYLAKVKEKKRVLWAESGQSTLYATPEHQGELYDAVKTRGALEDHIIRNAHKMLEELISLDMRDPDKANIAMSWKCGMLVQAVDKFRELRHGAPDINHPKYEEYYTGKDGMITVTGWYAYWLDVLEFLRAL
jgi:hypothetical protein